MTVTAPVNRIKVMFLILLTLVSLASCEGCEDSNPWSDPSRRAIGSR